MAIIFFFYIFATCNLINVHFYKCIVMKNLISTNLFVSLTEEFSRVFGTSYSVGFKTGEDCMYLYSEDYKFSRSFFYVLSDWCYRHQCTFIVDFVDFEIRVFLK